MSEQITTAAELDALPVGSVVMEGADGRPQNAGPFGIPIMPVMPGVFHRFPDGWYVVAGHGHREPEFDLGTLTVLYRPDAPVRTLPSVEDVARALIRYETGGMCALGRTCGLCDCGRADLTPERQAEWDAHELDRARAVLALFDQQPTVAEAEADR